MAETDILDGNLPASATGGAGDLFQGAPGGDDITPGGTDRAVQAGENASDAVAEAARQQQEQDRKKNSDPLAEFGDKVSPASILAGDGWLDTNASPAEGAATGKSFDDRLADLTDANNRGQQLSDWWKDHGGTADDLQQEKASLDGEYQDISTRAATGKATQEEIDSYIARANDWQQRNDDFWREGGPAIDATQRAQRDIATARRGIETYSDAAEEQASARAAGTPLPDPNAPAGTPQEFDQLTQRVNDVLAQPTGTATAQFDDLMKAVNDDAAKEWLGGKMWYDGGTQAGPKLEGPFYDDTGSLTRTPKTPDEQLQAFEERTGHPFSPATNPDDKLAWDALQYDIQRQQFQQAYAGTDPRQSLAHAMELVAAVTDIPTRAVAALVASPLAAMTPVGKSLDLWEAIGTADPSRLFRTVDGYPISQLTDFLAAAPYIIGGDTSLFNPNTKTYFDYLQSHNALASTFLPFGSRPMPDLPVGPWQNLGQVPIIGGFAQAYAASFTPRARPEIVPSQLYKDIQNGMSVPELEKKYPTSLGPQLLWDLFLNPINYIEVPGVETAARGARAIAMGDSPNALAEVAREMLGRKGRAIQDARYAEIAVDAITQRLAENRVGWEQAIRDAGLHAQPAGVRDAVASLARGEAHGYAWLDVNARQFLRDVYSGAGYQFEKLMGVHPTDDPARFERFLAERSRLPENVEAGRAPGQSLVDRARGFEAGTRQDVMAHQLQAWANDGRQIRMGVADPWGMTAKAQSVALQNLEIGAKWLASKAIGGFKVGLLALNPAYYMANGMTNMWQMLQYGVRLNPLHLPAVSNLFDRLASYRGGGIRSPEVRFRDRWGHDMPVADGVMRDITGVEQAAYRASLAETFNSNIYDRVRVATPEGPKNPAEIAGPLTRGQQAMAGVQRIGNLPGAALSTVMKPFGSDIEHMFRASAFEKHFTTAIGQRIQERVLTNIEREIGRGVYGPRDVAIMREAAARIRNQELTNARQVTEWLKTQHIGLAAGVPDNPHVFGWVPQRDYTVIRGGAGYQAARRSIQASLRRMDEAIAAAKPADRPRLVAEKQVYADRAAKFDQAGVTPPPGMYLTGDPAVMQRLAYLNSEIEHHAYQANHAVLTGGDPTAHLNVLYERQREYFDVMRQGLNLGPQNILTGDERLLAAMRTLEDMHQQAWDEASHWLPQAVRLSMDRAAAYTSEFGHLPLDKRRAFLNEKMFDERMAMGGAPAHWTYEDRKYPTSKLYDKTWAQFFVAKSQMEQAIAAHWDLMQHGVPADLPVEGAAVTPPLPDAAAPLPPHDPQLAAFEQRVLTPEEWAQLTPDTPGTSGPNLRPLTDAQWRQVQAGAGERIWQQEIDRYRTLAESAPSDQVDFFHQHADAIQAMGWQGFIERQEANLAAMQAESQRINQAINPDWPTEQERKQATGESGKTFVREGGRERLVPNDVAAKRELLEERRREMVAALNGKTGEERQKIVDALNWQNAFEGYDLPIPGAVPPMELRQSMIATGRNVSNRFEINVKARMNDTTTANPGGTVEDRQRLVDAAKSLKERADAHQAERERLRADMERMVAEAANPTKVDAEQLAKRYEAMLATMPEKLPVTRAELEQLRELAALGHLPYRAGAEDALAYVERVLRLMPDPTLKPEWELTPGERMARYRDIPEPAGRPSEATESGGSPQPAMDIPPPRYEPNGPTERHAPPQPEGWSSQLPDRFIPTDAAAVDGARGLAWLEANVPRLLDGAIRQTIYDATNFTNRVFIDYGLNIKFLDGAAKALFAFPTYATRTPLQFAERIAAHPGQLVAYRKASEDVLADNRTNHPNARASQQMKVHIGDKLVDFRDLLPFAKLIDPLLYPVNVPEDPTQRTDLFSRFVRAATTDNNILGRPQPFVEAPLKKAGVLPRDFTPAVTNDNLQQLSMRVFGRDVTPQGLTQRAASGLVGGTPINTDAYESYIRDQLAAMELEAGDKADRNRFREAAATKSGPLWDQAKQRADAWLQANRDYRGAQPTRAGVQLPNEEQIGAIRAGRNAQNDNVRAVAANPLAGPNDLAVAKRQRNDYYENNPPLDALSTGPATVERRDAVPGQFIDAVGSAGAGFDIQREQAFANRRGLSDTSLGGLYEQRENIQQHYGVGSPEDVAITEKIVAQLRDPSANYPGENLHNKPMPEQETARRALIAEDRPKQAALTEMQYGLGPYFTPETQQAALAVLKYEDGNKDVRGALKAAGYNDAVAQGAFDYARQIAAKVDGGTAYLNGLASLKHALGVDQMQLAQDDYVLHHPELGQTVTPNPDRTFRATIADPETRALLQAKNDRTAALFQEHPEYRTVLDGLNHLPEGESEDHYIAQHRDVFDALNAINGELNKRGLGLAEYRQDQWKAGQGIVNPNTPAYQRDAFVYDQADAPTQKAIIDRSNLRNDLWRDHPEWRDLYHEYGGLTTPEEKRAFSDKHRDLFDALDAIDARITLDDAVNPRLASFRESSALAAKGFGDPANTGFLNREHLYFDTFTQAERQAFDQYNAFVQGETGRHYLDLVSELMDQHGGLGTPDGKAWFAAHKDEYNAAKQAYNDGLRAIAVTTGADPLTVVNRIKQAEGQPTLAHNAVTELADPKPAGTRKGGRVGGERMTKEQAMAAGLAKYNERVQWQRDALANFGEVTQRGAADPMDKLADFNKHTPELDWMRFYEPLSPWEKATLKEQGIVPAKGSSAAQYQQAIFEATKILHGPQRNRYDTGMIKGRSAGIPGGPYGNYSLKGGTQFAKQRGTGIKPGTGKVTHH